MCQVLLVVIVCLYIECVHLYLQLAHICRSVHGRDLAIERSSVLWGINGRIEWYIAFWLRYLSIHADSPVFLLDQCNDTVAAACTCSIPDLVSLYCPGVSWCDDVPVSESISTFGENTGVMASYSTGH